MKNFFFFQCGSVWAGVTGGTVGGEKRVKQLSSSISIHSNLQLPPLLPPNPGSLGIASVGLVSFY